MKLFTIKSEELAHNSYFLTDGEEAAVVDPRRDCQVYTRLAQRECVRIRYIFETHRNEDYVVGSTELRNVTEAEVCHSKELPFKYGEHSLSDGETLTLDALKIKAVYTPGHTDESLCYIVYMPAKSADAVMAFTGDTLFVGSVGRTDLQGEKAQPKQAEKLYTGICEKLLPLGDQVLVYPAHGAGSVCGNDISDQGFSTLGYEKKTNPYLKLSREAFIERALAQEFLVPPYFRKMEEYNLNGAPLLHGLPEPKPLSVSEFEAESHELDTEVVDTRLPYAFAGSHIPGSLSLWLGGTAVYPGWLLNYDQRVLFVLERPSDIVRVSAHFWRLGFDNIYGFLCKGMSEWQEQGKPISRLGVLSASELKEKLDLKRAVVLDVREPHEWSEDGWIEGAERVFFGHLPQRLEGMERNRRYAVTCSVGNRGSIAASLLKRKNFVEVYNVLGGMTAWRNLGYPVTKE
ncbi:MAG: rhodanese-like domain-containing protein [Candidatus Bathyarchaeia archaeon]